MKLNLLKNAINLFLPQINKIVGMQKRLFKRKPTQIIDNVFKRLIERAEFETKARITMNDRNFLRLVTTLHNVLIYISEEDNYYSVWLMVALLMITDETVKMLKHSKLTKGRSWYFTWFLGEMSEELSELLKIERVTK